ncbi:MAG: hypothetical protein NTY69_01230 [Methylococcales bacterium]|nr:hypothetical protein [Methylococcales bacterium]
MEHPKNLINPNPREIIDTSTHISPNITWLSNITGIVIATSNNLDSDSDTNQNAIDNYRLMLG